MKHTGTNWTISLFFVTVMVTGCADNSAVKIRYNLEKQVYRAEKSLRDSRVSSGVPSSDRLEPVRQEFGRAADYAYAALDSVDEATYPREFRRIEELAFKSANRLAQLYFNEQKADTCVVITQRLIDNVRMQGEPAATAYYNLGRALQASGQWDSAVTVYQYALKRFNPPVFQKNRLKFDLFNLPLHLYEVVRRTGNDVEREQRFEYGVEYYGRILEDYPGEFMGIPTHANLARLYELHGNFEQAIAHLEQLADTTGRINANAHLRIADIYGVGINDVDRALQEYSSLQQTLSGADTILAPTVLLKTALAYLKKQEYQRARQILIDLEDRYRRYYQSVPTAQLVKAQTFDEEGNWDRAETEYKFLIENYAGTSEAMSTYLYLARYFEEQGREREMAFWYSRAETHFDEISARFQGTPRDAAARSYKAELYKQKEDWNRAASILSDLFDAFPTTPVGQRAMISASRIYADKLDNRAVADSLIGVLRNRLTEVDARPGI